MLDLLRSHDTKLVRSALALALAAIVVAPGCSSDDTSATPQTEGGACPPGGGPAPGTAEDRCMGTFQEVGMCPTEPEDGGESDAGPEMEPPTNVGNDANDDDCKYRVSFTDDCVQKNGAGTTFTVSLKSLTKNMMPVSGANAYVEAFLSATHPAGGNTAGTEPSPGVYKIPGVVFDQGGRWTVRFHFFGECSDAPEDSPHGHAAFFIDVPN